MSPRQWALVRASRVADRSLQRIADVGVALVLASSPALAWSNAALARVLELACRLGDKTACQFANQTAGEDER